MSASQAYAFRFRQTPQEKPYADMLDAWIEGRMSEVEGLRKSQALQLIVCGLIDAYVGEPLSSSNAITFDVQALKNELRAELEGDLRSWIRGLLADTERVQVITSAAAQMQDGEQVDDDVLNNILEDFVR